MAMLKTLRKSAGLLQYVFHKENRFSRFLGYNARKSVGLLFDHHLDNMSILPVCWSAIHPRSQSCRGLASGKSIFSYSDVDYIVSVKTGDQIHAGTDANVFIILHSETGEVSDPINLDYFFRDDFERGQLDVFQLKSIAYLKDIHKIEIFRDEAGLASEWFLDYIEIESVGSRKRFIFPAFRWIKPNRRYVIRHMDNCLPQFDPEPAYRSEELDMKREMYECAMKVPGGPAQVRNLLINS